MGKTRRLDNHTTAFEKACCFQIRRTIFFGILFYFCNNPSVTYRRQPQGFKTRLLEKSFHTLIRNVLFSSPTGPQGFKTRLLGKSFHTLIRNVLFSSPTGTWDLIINRMNRSRITEWTEVESQNEQK